jgi:hypothetical protein
VPTARRRKRQRRYRARLREGRMVPDMPDIGAEEIEFLIMTEWLGESEAADRRAVGAAIARNARGRGAAALKPLNR